ncbi:hypothetical protein EDB84DRAFT_1562020 [Lactarius hengduanensis]|nr:hypothetical protein EDB84DRAFT_1562020 [Lactarius hengduanensis]
MAVLSLPLSFSNSFWTQDYRKGLEVLYDKLEQGASENTEILAFIRARAQAEDDIGVALASITKTTSGTAFGADDGATLLMAFRGLQSETAQQGGVLPGNRTRAPSTRCGPLREVIKLKNTYLSKVRKADEAEEDAKFAPNSELTDKYTTSPRLHPRERPVRTATISERIAQKFKDIQRKTSDLAEGGTKVDKGKGKAVEEPSGSVVNASPPPLSPQLPPTSLGIKASSPTAPPEPSEPMLLAGLSLPPAAVSDLLARASAELKLQSISFPIVLAGAFERAEEAAKELTDAIGLLRRIGDIGNAFEPLDDASTYSAKGTFELGKQGARTPYEAQSRCRNLIKRSNNFLNVVSKALAANANGEPPLVRARLDADAADREYRIAFHGTLANLPRALEAPLERSASHIAAYLPDSDLSALIERYRTGPFRPQPQVYESVAHDESDVYLASTEEMFLRYVRTSGRLATSISQVAERLCPSPPRKSQCCSPEQPIPADIMTNYDTPVLASAVKLWLLELDPPISLWEGWEDLRRLYPNGGERTYDEYEHLEALKMALLRLPKIHLYVLMHSCFISSVSLAPIYSLRTDYGIRLIENTDVEETDEVYVTKLALSIGRTVLRPKFETSVSVQDRHPTAFFVDLVKHHADVYLPQLPRRKPTRNAKCRSANELPPSTCA